MANKQTYKVTVKRSNGATRHRTIKATSEAAARKHAETHSYPDEKIVSVSKA